MAIPQKVVLDGKFVEPKEIVAPFALKAKKGLNLLVEEINNHLKGFDASDLEVKLVYHADVKTRVNGQEQIVPIELIDMRNENKTVVVNVLTFNQKSGIRTLYTARIDNGTEENNLKGFEVKDDEVIQTYSQDGEIMEFEKPDLLHNPRYVPGGTITAQLDWTDGTFCLEDENNNREYNHCGPGCGDFSGNISGSGGTPINGIDSCCRAHDRCWSNFGEGDNCCDAQIAKCIDPYQDQDYASWFQINTYFGPQGFFC